MNEITRYLAPAAIMAVSVLGATAAYAEEVDAGGHRNAYAVTPLVSDVAGQAAVPDSALQNAWGVAFTPGGSPFWVNDNVTGCSTLYAGDGTTIPLQVSIPLPGNVVPTGSCRPVDPKNPPSPKIGRAHV